MHKFMHLNTYVSRLTFGMIILFAVKTSHDASEANVMNHLSYIQQFDQ